VPKAFPAEFRADVIAVARKGEAPLRQIAKDFGISEACLHRWLKIADREDGIDRSGATSTVGDVSAELREARNGSSSSSKKPRSCAARSGISAGTSTQVIYPLVLDLGTDGVPVMVTCRVLGFSTQGFYKWRKAPLTQRDWDDAHLINAALDIHADDPAFGYRFIADELPARGIIAGENKVARLCSQERIWSIFAKKRGLNRKAGPPVHDDLVHR
jgi:putative transposase